MSRYLLVGTPDNASLHLIDLEQGTVEEISPDAVDETLVKVRPAGVFRGVDVAIAIEDRPEPVGRFFFNGGAVP